jgi:hypothetical protein
VAVPLPAGEKVVSVPQDDNDGKGSNNDDFSTDDDEGSGSNDDEDKAICIPFCTTPAGSMSFKCPMCLGEQYDSEATVVLHAIDVSKQDTGLLDLVEQHRQVLWAR